MVVIYSEVFVWRVWWTRELEHFKLGARGSNCSLETVDANPAHTQHLPRHLDFQKNVLFPIPSTHRLVDADSLQARDGRSGFFFVVKRNNVVTEGARATANKNGSGLLHVLRTATPAAHCPSTLNRSKLQPVRRRTSVNAPNWCGRTYVNQSLPSQSERP